ncbi:serine/threonine-protein kinase [Streptomyces sp. NPDC002795]|uniref:serine/threonine-protein kinase n=1 Tax=Streptomyces sp. NPDC002795 TaxID=3364665 RepID=UPI0036CCD0B6
MSEENNSGKWAVEGLDPLTAHDPARIGSYLLLGRLGAGGMGRVYLARSEGGRTVAVKVVHEEHVADARFRARFRREIEAARRVGERYTAPVLDADPDADRPWVATGYVPGLSLEQAVRRYGPLPAASVHALADGLLHALRDIHAAGIVHRDLKPSNVMLAVAGPRVIDFGIARALETSVESLLTSTGVTVGSPGFMSPEQIKGQEIGPGSDVFSLGCVLAYAATGQLAFGQGATNQHAVNYHAVESEPGLGRVRDRPLRELIARCLTKDVGARPAVAGLLDAPDRTTPKAAEGAWLPPQLVAALAQRAAMLLDVEAVPLREEPTDRATYDLKPRAAAPEPAPAPSPTAEPERRRKRRWPVIVPVVAVVVVGGGTALVLGPYATDRTPEAAATASPTPAGSATTAPARPSASASESASGKEKGEKQRDPGPAPGKGASGGGEAADDAAADEGTGSGADVSGGGGSTGAGTSGSSGGGDSSSGGGSGAVADYFVGTWTFSGGGGGATTYVPATIRISDGEVGDNVVHSTLGDYSQCTYTGRLLAVTDSGRRLKIGSAAADKSSAGAYCMTMGAHEIYNRDGDGFYRLTSNAEDKHYVR